MVADSLGDRWHQAWLTVVTATGIYLTMIALSRVFGQRQFATSSTYDLAFVFALGSLIGRVVLVHVSLLDAVIGLSTMFSQLCQALRLAGATSFEQVTAAILERNGSISIVRRGDHLDAELLAEVVGTEQLHPNKDVS